LGFAAQRVLGGVVFSLGIVVVAGAASTIGEGSESIEQGGRIYVTEPLVTPQIRRKRAAEQA